MPCSCGKDYSLHCEALTSEEFQKSPWERAEDCHIGQTPTKLFQWDWVQGSSLTCVRLWLSTSWKKNAHTFIKMDSWIANGQCRARFESIFSLCACVTWTETHFSNLGITWAPVSSAAFPPLSLAAPASNAQRGEVCSSSPRGNQNSGCMKSTCVFC